MASSFLASLRLSHSSSNCLHNASIFFIFMICLLASVAAETPPEAPGPFCAWEEAAAAPAWVAAAAAPLIGGALDGGAFEAGIIGSSLDAEDELPPTSVAPGFTGNGLEASSVGAFAPGRVTADRSCPAPGGGVVGGAGPARTRPGGTTSDLDVGTGPEGAVDEAAFGKDLLPKSPSLPAKPMPRRGRKEGIFDVGPGATGPVTSSSFRLTPAVDGP
mmetsp:Transcript_95895/g.276944  ORF Transcript_95895/g.276944 Transcript_95895/m.276944 type:complete len:217 (+) Transcript_95895:729-1379(+)